MKRAWCQSCGSMVEYEVEQGMRDYQFDDISVRYNRMVARCPCCRSVLYVPDIVDGNISRRIEALNRKRRGEGD